MKFTTFTATLALASGALAEAPVERDLATIQTVVNNVGDQLKKLSTAVNEFKGDINGLANAAGGFVNTLQQGTQQVEGTTPITLNEALQLQSVVGGLQNDGNALIKGLKDKKPEFEKANLCTVILTNIDQTGTGATKLIDAVVKKVPQDVQQIAAQVAGSFAKTLSDAKADFEPGKCNNANGQGGGGGGMAGNGTMTGGMPKSTSPAAAGAAGVTVGLGAVAVAAFAALLL
ncbi:Cell wall mannoprotein 1 [Colletotrichum spinosum]|uniref:Cell wall mannoprotein 1 n=1 Tax=Colletotrichum spinosum TaxID=1347390 RepID=A0A4R8QR23_9PEZI|nr:Cell wall mannoprotein 1 [Colletotrichum spinosum]